MTTAKGNPSSAIKNVPPPKLPSPEPGDENFLGFDNDYKFYYIGKKKWQYHIGGFNTADRATAFTKDFDDLGITQKNLGVKSINFLEQQKSGKELTKEEIEEFTNTQVLLTEAANKKTELQKDMIKFVTLKCLREADGKEFNLAHFDDDNIPLRRWWQSSLDIINFLLVGDTQEGMTQLLMQSKSETQNS